ncbi:hypothetical protein Glove_26g211 [Diversispora epigaea]|uniref:Uncharacterized protein n=1 Tax=Diversispora epigaea TaxID=1348612 RepID=A0A397JKD6_9GLOM|nr:hypothetical protein Glove_26g211 [Diversispora epigaea]
MVKVLKGEQHMDSNSLLDMPGHLFGSRILSRDSIWTIHVSKIDFEFLSDWINGGRLNPYLRQDIYNIKKQLKKKSAKLDKLIREWCSKDNETESDNNNELEETLSESSPPVEPATTEEGLRESSISSAFQSYNVVIERGKMLTIDSQLSSSHQSPSSLQSLSLLLSSIISSLLLHSPSHLSPLPPPPLLPIISSSSHHSPSPLHSTVINNSFITSLPLSLPPTCLECPIHHFN